MPFRAIWSARGSPPARSAPPLSRPAPPTTSSDQGRLITADNLITAARNLGLNPVNLLVRYGLVPASAAVEYTEEISSTLGVVTRTPTRAETGQAKYDPNAPGL